MSKPSDGSMGEPIQVTLRITPEQLRDISGRADLRPFDGNAVSRYILGCALNEPPAELLKTVHQIRDEERTRFRSEFNADRRRRGEPEWQPVERGPACSGPS